MRYKKEYQRGSKVKAIIFFGVLIATMIVSLIIPLRPTVSEVEKRELEKFPSFSTEDLVSGEYFREIDTWFADTFPFRDMFFEVNAYVRSLYGFKTVEVHGKVESGDDIPTDFFGGK